MQDNARNTGRGEDQRIKVGQDFEIRYWTGQLKVSEETLRKAVSAVGPMVKDVRKWLKENRF